MRIGLVLAQPPGYSETFFRSKINGLTKHGFEVELFVGNNAEISEEFKVHKALPIRKGNLVIQSLWIFLAFFMLLFTAPNAAYAYYKMERNEGNSFRKSLESVYTNAHILKRKLDWLHFGFTTLAVGKENVAAAIGAKMATSMRGFDVSIYPLKNKGIYDKLWPRLDKVHVISDDIYQVGLQLGLPENLPVVKITPAIKLARFSNSATTSLSTKLNQTPVRILTVARLHWKKGLEYALAALHLLDKMEVDFIYEIVGEGPEYERLLFETNQYLLKDKVRFLGKKTPDEIAVLMQNSFIYIQPSIQEGFCNAVLEAQASGLLCIVSDAEGLSENVLDGQTGWVLPKRDFHGLTNTIQEILKMPSESLDQIVKNARNRVADQFNIIDQIKKFIKFYQQ